MSRDETCKEVSNGLLEGGKKVEKEQIPVWARFLIRILEMVEHHFFRPLIGSLSPLSVWKRSKLLGEGGRLGEICALAAHFLPSRVRHYQFINMNISRHSMDIMKSKLKTCGHFFIPSLHSRGPWARNSSSSVSWSENNEELKCRRRDDATAAFLSDGRCW